MSLGSFFFLRNALTSHPKLDYDVMNHVAEWLDLLLPEHSRRQQVTELLDN